MKGIHAVLRLQSTIGIIPSGTLSPVVMEDDVTALAGAAAYRGPQNFNCVCVCLCVCVCVCVCLCIARSPDWRGLETSGLLEEFRLNF